MRTWLLTSTFYGNWLPGSERGFVGRVRESRVGDLADDRRREHDDYGTDYDAEMSGLHRHARAIMKGEPIRITHEQAGVLFFQFRETARVRGWGMRALAVMANHVHWVVELPDDIHGNIGLQGFKAYGSRALNRRWGTPRSGTWWTSKGSTRLKLDEAARQAAIRYVRKQENALVIWSTTI